MIIFYIFFIVYSLTTSQITQLLQVTIMQWIWASDA